MERYALYFAAAPDSPWWQAGCSWLGRDAATMQTLRQPAISAVAPELQQALTRNARRYGFHATLKAPFHLAPGRTLDELQQALQAFCAQQAPLALPAPRVHWMGNFLALLPATESHALNALALRCVSHFDSWRAELSAEALARRQRQAQSPRQRQLLQRWGYPYTEEEFRFHLTLSDTLDACSHSTADALQRAATSHFAIADALRIDGVALFCEKAPGADFQLLQRYRFGC